MLDGKNMRQGYQLSKYLLSQGKTLFEPHISDLAVLKGLAEGRVVCGELFVSHHNNAKAWFSADNGLKLNCSGFIARNRALSGDRVYAKITEVPSQSLDDEEVSPKSLSPINSADVAVPLIEKSCKVVAIQKRSGQRYVCRAKEGEALVQPRDVRFPAMRPEQQLNVSGTALALVNLKSWEDTEQYPYCTLIRLLGPEGSFDAEDDSILEMNGLVSDKYSDEIEKELRKLFPDSSSVINSELKFRKDIRKSERIFSIDPPSAKDLDDAISISRVDDKRWRVGVHVADVSHFVHPNSKIDKEAAQRATSVYFARKVYPMLPAYLSENLCSLLPGEDRLAVSVFFVLNSESGEVEGSPTIDRTIIRSLVKLNYDDVDAALAGPDVGGPIPSAEIFNDIKILMSLTEKLRERRTTDGSVTIDDRNGQSEICFEFLSPDFPISVQAGKVHRSSATHDSHTLIEELMVLTNRIVAERLCSEADVAVLRRHLDSESAVLDAASDFLKRANLKIDEFGTKSLREILSEAKAIMSSSLFSAFTHVVLSEFNRAEYVTGGSENCESLSHWGVGAKRYMHFTSPIRRYADLITHRKLLGENVGSMGNKDYIKDQLSRCNINSKAAKDAEKENKMFYYTVLVKSFGSHGMWTEGIVDQLIAPNPDHRGIKGSISIFLPLVGESRSQSLSSLGLSFVKMENREDDSIGCMVVADRYGHERRIALLESIKLRVYVKNPNASLPKIHIRVDNVPNPPIS